MTYADKLPLLMELSMPLEKTTYKQEEQSNHFSIRLTKSHINKSIRSQITSVTGQNLMKSFGEKEVGKEIRGREKKGREMDSLCLFWKKWQKRKRILLQPKFSRDN